MWLIEVKNTKASLSVLLHGQTVKRFPSGPSWSWVSAPRPSALLSASHTFHLLSPISLVDFGVLTVVVGTDTDWL